LENINNIPDSCFLVSKSMTQDREDWATQVTLPELAVVQWKKVGQ